MCLCIPTDCNLETDSDCTSRYIMKGSLGCDDNCNGCRANECQQAVCGSVGLSFNYLFVYCVSVIMVFTTSLLLCHQNSPPLAPGTSDTDFLL